MHQELELTMMDARAAHIQPLLYRFTAESGIAVRLRLLSWDTAWNALFTMALQGTGPDVSEIGSTWLGDLIAAQALHDFGSAELAELGAPANFLPVAWHSTHLPGQAAIWAIPWLAGARLLFFRRDLLARAGIDEATAFASAEALDRTIGQLEAQGVRVPWTVPVGTTHATLLNLASWVWGAGGDFITPDGTRTLFSGARARAGMRAYFALGRYLTPAVRYLTGSQPDEQFLYDPETALTMSGPWLFLDARREGLSAEALGIALPPGPAFVGGSHLVIWKHSRRPEAALQLIRFLTQPPAQIEYSQKIGLLPATREALAGAPFAGDPLWQQTIQALSTGRTFPVTRAWGMIEYRLAATLNTLWAETLAHSNQDLDAMLARTLEPLARRLDQLLSQNH